MESRPSFNNNNKVLLLIILGAVVFFVFVLPLIEKCNEKEVKESLANTESIVKVDTNRCSKQCCKFTQWPVPHDVKQEGVDNNVGSNFSCNFGQGSGCVCMTKSDVDFLSNRGGNS